MSETSKGGSSAATITPGATRPSGAFTPFRAVSPVPPPALPPFPSYPHGDVSLHPQPSTTYTTGPAAIPPAYSPYPAGHPSGPVAQAAPVAGVPGLSMPPAGVPGVVASPVTGVAPHHPGIAPQLPPLPLPGGGAISFSVAGAQPISAQTLPLPQAGPAGVPPVAPLGLPPAAPLGLPPVAAAGLPPAASLGVPHATAAGVPPAAAVSPAAGVPHAAAMPHAAGLSPAPGAIASGHGGPWPGYGHAPAAHWPTPAQSAAAVAQSVVSALREPHVQDALREQLRTLLREPDMSATVVACVGQALQGQSSAPGR